MYLLLIGITDKGKHKEYLKDTDIYGLTNTISDVICNDLYKQHFKCNSLQSSRYS